MNSEMTQDDLPPAGEPGACAQRFPAHKIRAENKKVFVLKALIAFIN